MPVRQEDMGLEAGADAPRFGASAGATKLSLVVIILLKPAAGRARTS
jgi:hypothetical protein